MAALTVAALSLAVVAMLAVLRWPAPQAYGDFIAGYLSMHDAGKTSDLLAVPAFLVVLLGSLGCLSWLMRCDRAGTEDDAGEFACHLVWWCLPALMALGGAVAGRPPEPALAALSALAVGAMVTGRALATLRGRRMAPVHASLCALAALLAALSPLEVALVAGRLGIASWPAAAVEAQVHALPRTFAMALVAMTAFATFAPALCERALPLLLAAGQAGLALWFACVVPAEFALPDGTTARYPASPWLWGIATALAGWVVADIVRRQRLFTRDATRDWAVLIAPGAMFALAVAARFGATAVPEVKADDYHFGEFLLGGWSYLQGSVPYVDYIPPHGIAGDDLPGLLAHVFLDGTAASVPEAQRLTHLLLSLPAFLALRSLTRSTAVAVAFVLLMFGGTIWLFLVPFACLWLHPALLRAPARWLAAWVAGLPVLLLGLPANALLLAAATAPVAALMCRRMIADPRRRPGSWRLPLGVAAVLGVLCLATPLGAMLWGACRYVIEVGPINQLAYGVPWALSWNGQVQSGLVFELIRMSWLAVAVTCLIHLVQARPFTGARFDAALPMLVAALFLLLLLPYTMGRIDPAAGSRPAAVSILAWTALLPIALWAALDRARRAVWLMVIVLVGASLNVALPGLRTLAFAALPKIALPGLRSGAAGGLPNLGTGIVHAEHWARLTRLNALLNRELPPGAPYLDLTGRHAQYFHTGRKPPLAITAPYNLVSAAQQRREVARLTRDPPGLVLAEGDNLNEDGGGLALRNPVLLRHVLRDYVPARVDGFIIGLRPAGGTAVAEAVIGQVKDFTDVNWVRGVNRLDAALILTDAALVAQLAPGQVVRMPDGPVRRIVSVRKDVDSIWLDGPAFGAAPPAPEARLMFELPAPALARYRTALWQKAFALPDLQKLPVAWGRSGNGLADAMHAVASLSSLRPALHDLRLESGSYHVNGPDPHLVLDLSALRVAGEAAGLLKLRFTCLGRSAEPRLQLFWWGDEEAGSSEAASLRFTADDGTLIVPLDSAPHWIALRRVMGLRIDLDDARACAAIRIEDAGLFQRAAIKR